MSGMFGWLAQPAVLPWVALAFGLCIGSFLNVVIHRLPKMLERGWRAECAELAGQPVAARARATTWSSPRSRLPGLRPRHPRLENVPLAELARAARQVLRLPRAHQPASTRWSKRSPASAPRTPPGASASSAAALGATLFIWFTIALAFIDQETGLLPDDLTLPLLWIGLLLEPRATLSCRSPMR